ncbi:hypothetical protein [Streptomyces griseoaurantiacus]|uniref:Uncharacterized protein n=1 Tax=Streptomyces griseoaurantiacus M045 TaxID=996637 RepID=F3NJV7_9ACTN|nr:hypothetical protein [Streptomyces griseoaurantiacus]EGG46368.1 hypothetical protein SGM_3421 [Streptomyces griseoaurantiacus M045]
MHSTPTLVDAPASAAPARGRRRLVLGSLAAVLTVAVVGGAAYAYHEYKKPSQASAADCRLAQDIVTEAQRISTGPVPEAEKWWKKTGDKRRREMKDGYLGVDIATYEGWAVESAKQHAGKSAEVPSKRDVTALQEQARGHCSDSGVTVSMPRFGN